MEIKYVLNGGIWAPKDEVKEAFYTELYNFVNSNYDTELKEMSLADFIVSEPYIIGNMVGKYFLKEEVGGKVENQPENYFIGYLYRNKKFLDLIPHLIHFFALWREIENCTEPNATDFFANSWASLVDTAKFFKYTTVEDLRKSPEAPSVQDPRILNMLQNCPGLYHAPTEFEEGARIPKPKRDNYEFIGWYDNPEFEGEVLTHLVDGVDIYYARWATHTFFHSNDGYATFDDLYTDFLNDFSEVVGKQVTKDVERLPKHGPVSEFCKESFNGNLNKFFATPKYYDKWIWLIDWFRSLMKDNPKKLRHFEFADGKFGLEAQVRWELNSLFVSRFHLTWPITGDYSGIGIKEKLADSTNSSIIKVKYPVGENVKFPKMNRDGYELVGFYDNHELLGEQVTSITDDTYAAKTLYAKWNKL
ncbi:MAG TPA: InlB B-repeat-containing protein [Acholeplasmataceae bacterium]|nr:InlB B-repeat-containing protein [Acholeplasmataceae bacterium]